MTEGPPIYEMPPELAKAAAEYQALAAMLYSSGLTEEASDYYSIARYCMGLFDTVNIGPPEESR